MTKKREIDFENEKGVSNVETEVKSKKGPTARFMKDMSALENIYRHI